MLIDPPNKANTQEHQNFPGAPPLVQLKTPTPSVKGDYRLKGGVNQARLITEYLNSERYRQVFPNGFPYERL
jgi:hypothetical protein